MNILDPIILSHVVCTIIVGDPPPPRLNLMVATVKQIFSFVMQGMESLPQVSHKIH